MIEKNGNVFDTSAKYIGHGVNCEGVMGAGVAKMFRDLFPANYAQYKFDCERGYLKPGGYTAMPVRLNDRQAVVVNFASQNLPGPDARYTWLFSAVANWAEAASDPKRLTRNGGIIAIPEIGCGIGGLKWDNVEAILKCIETMYPVEFEVWHYEG